jgi:hypothetical protein
MQTKKVLVASYWPHTRAAGDHTFALHCDRSSRLWPAFPLLGWTESSPARASWSGLVAALWLIEFRILDQM